MEIDPNKYYSNKEVGLPHYPLVTNHGRDTIPTGCVSFQSNTMYIGWKALELIKERDASNSTSDGGGLI